MAERAFRFGDYEIDSTERLLRRAGVVVPLGSRATAALLALLERPGRLLSKQELLERLWPDAVVEENNLDQCISALRKALEDSPRAPRFLETMARRGYRRDMNGVAAVALLQHIKSNPYAEVICHATVVDAYKVHAAVRHAHSIDVLCIAVHQS